MKTNNWKVESLEDNELVNTSGGIIAFILGVAVSIALCCLDDPDGFRQGFHDGFNG